MNPLAAAILREAEGIAGMFTALWAELRELTLVPPRGRICAAATLSVAIATIVALAMHIDDPWWAGVSAFVCSQATRPASISKGVLRIIGTVVGALLALALGSWLAYDPVACALALLLVSFIGLLGFQVSPHAYAWLLGSMTFDLIILTALTAPATAFNSAAYRTIEVVLGVAAAILMALLLAADDEGSGAAQAPGWRDVLDAPTPVMLHALRAGLTVMLIPLVWYWFELPSLAQMAITIAAVMAVPAAPANSPDPGRLMVTRAIHRLIGCLLGGVVSLICLAAPLTEFAPWLATLCAGVWIGSHVQASPRGIGYIGMQATIVFIMTLVQGSGPPDSIWPGVDRLGGIIFGILVLLAVSLVLAAFQPAPDARVVID